MVDGGESCTKDIVMPKGDRLKLKAGPEDAYHKVATKLKEKGIDATRKAFMVAKQDLI